ncbi:hypothetical protein QYF36_004047 [Acer negundo]|nr:hypothetical protein QYF36_004047 [Acer negundo]
MTYLEWVPPKALYAMLYESERNAIRVDIGDTSIESLKGNSDGLDWYDDLSGWFKTNNIFSPQVLNSGSMEASDMRDILNELVEMYDVDCFLFGFSTDRRYWDDETQYKFIERLVGKLDADENLKPKLFTFVDKSNSTKRAKMFLKKYLPRLFDLG